MPLHLQTPKGWLYLDESNRTYMNGTENQMLVIFGASGDLTARKLVPALFSLYKGRHLPERFVVLGVSRSNLSDDGFRKKVVSESAYLKDKVDKETTDVVQAFSDKMFYEDLGKEYDTAYASLEKRITELDATYKTGGNCIFYLSTPPSLYEVIAKNLCEANLTDETKGWKRLIVEKPFGYDLKSAKQLNIGLQRYFKESQIYRIDHYLGKETVQNLLVTRFANSIFEPLWEPKLYSPCRNHQCRKWRCREARWIL